MRAPDQRTHRSRLRPSRRVWLGGALLLAALVAVGCYLGVRAEQARSALHDAQDHAVTAKAALLSGDSRKSSGEASAVRASAADAYAATNDPLWRAAAALPWLGRPLASVREMTDTVTQFSDEVLVPSAALAGTIGPSTLRTADNGVDVAALRSAAPRITAMADDATRLAQRARGIDGTWLGPVAQARTDLAAQLDSAARTAQGTSVAARLAPAMLGADGPRNYFVALQTPSEARGTGGLVGGFIVIRAENGHLRAAETGRNIDMFRPSSPQIDLGDGFDTLYSTVEPYTDFRNSNLSPDFTDAAKIWMANWQAQTGTALDGAAALDPIALSYVLRVTGPVRLPSGEQITADNVVPLTLSQVYTRFADDNTARKEYLQTISRTVVADVLGAHADAGRLLEALGRGVAERRIMLYSSRSDEQDIIASTALAHQLPDDSAPLMDATITNAAGNKLDYYLRRELSYTAGDCSADMRDATARVTLTNTVTDLSLPQYVIGSMGAIGSGLPPGTNAAGVQIALTRGAQVRKVTLDGQSVLYGTSELHGHPVVRTRVPLAPGQRSVLEVTLTEPTSARGDAQVPVQPLVDTPPVHVSVPSCGAATGQRAQGSP
ncbi:DUF4012 domain-containing protein [Gordonia polyisoprenivorans]|uniref:DUF4012 domain-containing protein n=1 Tax=Gordonia polyisoprenivorans TaxID=84595 RepID=UPI000558B1E7|nr:DUF4012 domain-containing protein [Gordonia polyisoprenivorans]QUD81694.1 DUF4012 domain-containing protein [Gordonia polyisoprenivorans]UZF57539.1 DUF4012 domain-containing protein [Gordonia polyisoprenivorans]